MAVRTRRLSGPTLVASLGVATLYTVPTDRTAIIKSVQTWPSGAPGAGTAVTLYIGAPATGTKALVLSSASGEDHRTWIVLHEGETLQVGNGMASSVAICVNGTLLMGDPA